ncbi:uncharacterized protein N7484_010893 [Penicillium longicatenatum]|uniref:uncharacterized protein n=1 Tax=Penicillium longicatenatum TaxID=1561947 RepID=UPI0025474D27|nr:uncharacterized protein N7484_010893 [Penicillium longicatenatum]KAJ5630793.1 hypothetical protein N7484_010893 [Penicillium longicatenatum]
MFRHKCPNLEDPRQSEERLLAEENGILWTASEKKGSHFTKSFLWFTALSIFFMSGTLFGFFWRGDLDGLCSQHVSQYSPIMMKVGISYDTREFNGSLFKENIFRQDASPDVDAAWEALGVNYRGIRVPTADAEQSGLTADQVQINPKYGGGYPANVGGLHHLHCLNVIRQSLYYNYDYYHMKEEGIFSHNDYIVRRQISYCLDTLRQQLMCTVDTGVLGQIWVYPDNPEPHLDSSTHHRCKNFDQIRRWAEVNQLPKDPPVDYIAPPAPGTIYAEIP